MIEIQREQTETGSVEAKFMSLGELAQVLGITVQTASRMARRGDLPVRGFRLGRTWRFSRAEVARLAGELEPDHVTGN